MRVNLKSENGLSRLKKMRRGKNFYRIENSNIQNNQKDSHCFTLKG